MLSWFKKNLGTLLLSLILALTVWATAISQDNPTLERDFPEPIPINYTGLSQGLLIVNQHPEEAIVSLRAPSSVWEVIGSEDIYLEADLSGLEAGTYRVPIKHTVNLKPVQVVAVEPESLRLKLESSAMKELPIEVSSIGEPALGYQADEPVSSPASGSVLGPASAVDSVSKLLVRINLTNQQENLDQLLPVVPVDELGKTVEGVQVVPTTARITVVVRLQVNYRLVSVIPIIEGQEELEDAGYRVTEFSVTPALVTIFSSDPQAFADMPGFVETIPLNLAGEVDDVERRLPLNLPSGFSPVGDLSVLVQVKIEPRMNSITVMRGVEVQGLGSGLYALTSPEAVSVILTGPAATLEALQPEDVRVLIDMLNMGVGTYQLEPEIIALPPEVEASTPIPATIQITVTRTPPPQTPSP
jgi:YbbR domain-containing protein